MVVVVLSQEASVGGTAGDSQKQQNGGDHVGMGVYDTEATRQSANAYCAPLLTFPHNHHHVSASVKLEQLDGR